MEKYLTAARRSVRLAAKVNIVSPGFVQPLDNFSTRRNPCLSFFPGRCNYLVRASKARPRSAIGGIALKMYIHTHTSVRMKYMSLEKHAILTQPAVLSYRTAAL